MSGKILIVCGILLMFLGLAAPSIPAFSGAQYRETALFLPLVFTIIRPFVMAAGLLLAAIGAWMLRHRK
ncbi:MAG: hypothetical protein PHX87_06285 [Candidatus Peribacteraceae bacterium]|nr:hypothetical protein [Candidatus Peribacteraceae bacterium]MDD5742999.1 hypothetical protein [Candidatus Peribacteraceae bacterium]